MFKIICTGNPNDRGIAQAIKSLFPNADFLSRTTGYDLSLTDKESEERLLQKLGNYNVLINNAQICVGGQERLLKLTHSIWKTGHVFNIGSVAEYKRWENFDPPYTKEKRALRDLSLELGDQFFKTTHMIVGGFKDRSDNSDHKMDPIVIAKTIKWILENEVDIPIIGIERMSDHKNYWKGKRDENSGA